MPKIALGQAAFGWGLRSVAVSKPSAFSWTPPITIKRCLSSFTVTPDVSTFAPTGTAYYVDGLNGNDGNPGTAEQPLKKLLTAYNKGDMSVIYAKPVSCHYGRTRGFDGTNLTKSFSLRRWPGYSGQVVIHGGQDDLVWTLDGTYTNTWKTTRSAVLRVLDYSLKDSNGYIKRLVQRASPAEVEANPGSWHLDGSNVLWVRTEDSREPDLDIWPIVVNSCVLKGNITFYAEYCDFYSGYPFWMEDTGAGQTPKCYLKGCGFYHGTNNGATLEGVNLGFFQDCIAAKNDNDGFNYHLQNTNIPYGIEVNCQGLDNGDTGGPGNDNGSSIHEGGSIVRVNGTYKRNVGPNIIDVGEAYSWNLGCVASDSASDVSATRHGFSIDGNMWLHLCRAENNVIDLVSQGAGDNVYRRACFYATTGGSGNHGTY